jgi:hypothetical protein
MEGTILVEPHPRHVRGPSPVHTKATLASVSPLATHPPQIGTTENEREKLLHPGRVLLTCNAPTFTTSLTHPQLTRTITASTHIHSPRAPPPRPTALLSVPVSPPPQCHRRALRLFLHLPRRLHRHRFPLPDPQTRLQQTKPTVSIRDEALDAFCFLSLVK